MKSFIWVSVISFKWNFIFYKTNAVFKQWQSIFLAYGAHFLITSQLLENTQMTVFLCKYKFCIHLINWIHCQFYWNLNIFDGCSMLTGDTYSSGHLVLSHLGLAYVLLVEINPFPETVVILGTIRFEHPSLLSLFCFCCT